MENIVCNIFNKGFLVKFQNANEHNFFANNITALLHGLYKTRNIPANRYIFGIFKKTETSFKLIKISWQEIEMYNKILNLQLTTKGKNIK
jgi:hypothetical protein